MSGCERSGNQDGYVDMVPSKGREQFAVDRAVSFIEEIGFLHQDLIVKSDQESAVRAVVEEVGKARAGLGSGKWIVEHSPVRSSQSNGVVERAVQSVQGQLRVIKLALECHDSLVASIASLGRGVRWSSPEQVRGWP